MNEFEYNILIPKIETLKTKKAIKDMLKKLLHPNTTKWDFLALTYHIKYHKIFLGTRQSEAVKYNLISLNKKYNIKELTIFCNSDFEVTEYHLKQLLDSRYTTFQIAAYIFQHIKDKNE